MFNAPIPGQSLTTQPGARPWEKPPKTTDLDKAMASIVQTVTQPKAAKALLNYMEMEVPVEGLSQTLLMTYVMKGEFTVDMALMLMEPTCMLLAKIAMQAGIEPKFSSEDQDEDDGANFLVKMKSRKPLETISSTGVPADTEEEPTGLMGIGG